MYINDKLYVNITYIKERRRTQSLARNISSYVLKHNHCWIIILIYLFPVFLMKIIIKVRYLFVILSFERHIIVKIRKKSVDDHLKKYIIIKIFTETISCFRIEFVKASTHRLRSSSPSAPRSSLSLFAPWIWSDWSPPKPRRVFAANPRGQGSRSWLTWHRGQIPSL